MAKPKRSLKIGITGIRGAGKTMVRRYLSRLGGLSAMDADDYTYKSLLVNPDVARQIQRLLEKKLPEVHDPEDVRDLLNNWSHKQLYQLMHTNYEIKMLMSGIIEPLLRDEVKQFLYGPLGSYIRVVENTDIFETGSEHLYDEIWVVKADEPDVVKRLMERDSIHEDEARLQVMMGWIQEKKIDLGDRIIDNTGDEHNTQRNIQQIYTTIKNRSAGLR
ncbi:MAG: dephospho-CoA kinase [Candidatus Melainabacteria bacterium]